VKDLQEIFVVSSLHLLNYLLMLEAHLLISYYLMAGEARLICRFFPLFFLYEKFIFFFNSSNEFIFKVY
jgi:hypothetical protein